MPPKWTPQQKRAIEADGRNILVLAAAGSGKTAVLVERVIRRITRADDPVSIDRLLIATFTRAAASSVQAKLRDALRGLLDAQPDNEALARQLTLLPRATITTVHAFCQDVLRNSFHKLSLPASFEVGDETVLATLRARALDEVLEARYLAPTPAFEALSDGYGGRRDDEGLRELVLNLYAFSQSTADPAAWLSQCAENFTRDAGLNLWLSRLVSHARTELEGVAAAYRRVLEELSAADGLEKYRFAMEGELAMIQEAAASLTDDWNQSALIVSSLSFGRLPARSRDADADAAEYAKQVRNDIKKQCRRLGDLFSPTREDFVRDHRFLAPVAQVLCQLVTDLSLRYGALKREKGLVDFSDLEQLALGILRDPQEQEAYRRRFDEVLVDEYQDTNGVQDAIFTAVSRGNNLFMVGDVKQSIYGFRNAQPGIFTEKAARCQEDGARGEVVLLAHNFRSCDNVIGAVNSIFQEIMSLQAGGICYADSHALIGQRGGTLCEGPGVELHIIDKALETDEALTEEEEQTGDAIREAMFVARRIRTLVELEKPLIQGEHGPRALRYGDIAILARKNKGVANMFSEQMALLGIPSHCEDEIGGFAESVEITAMLSFLQIIDNPHQDIPLLAVLRSPMYSFSDEALSRLRAGAEGSFYQALRRSGGERAEGFLSDLRRYRRLSRRVPLEQLLRTILSETDYLAFAGAMPGGKTRTANLRLLCERAGRFEASGYRSVFDFLSYLDAMEAHAQGYSAAKTTGEGQDAVRIMTIHKSKGLEFPVVFLVRCGTRFNKSDLSGAVQYDLDLGVGFDVIDAQRRLKYPSAGKLAIVEKKLYSMLSEEMRVLYVALTRPRDMLFMVGSCAKAQEKLEKWERSDSSPYTVASQNTFLDWIGLAWRQSIRQRAALHTAQDILLGAREGFPVPSQISGGGENTTYPASLHARMSYTYPHLEARWIPSKLPVSLAAQSDTFRVNLKKPHYMEAEQKISAALRGTVIHFVMQNIDLEKTNTREEIEGQLQSMIDREMLPEDMRAVVDTAALADFFQSGAGRRMKASPRVEREYKFFVDMPARALLPALGEEAKGETILLQGVVDCFFEEDGALVVMDYKTGYADREQYHRQIQLYAAALSKITRLPVKETILYPLIS